MAEELEHRSNNTHLQNPAPEEHEDLQTTSTECRRLEEERDEAVQRLHEFHQVSQMVIEEVYVIQERLHIERTCRESAEALASKLNRQNHSLKRKSLMLLSHLSPETIREIHLDEDEDEDVDEEEELQGAGSICTSAKCQSTMTELKKELEMALKDRSQSEGDVEAVRAQLRDTKDQLLKEKQDNAVLRSETLQQKKLLGKYNRVSQLAVEEYQVLQDTLDLERDLRAEAETFAREMMVEQKKLKRQSHLLMHSSSPTHALQEALSQVSKLTQDLETQRLDHLHQMKQMEDRLSRHDAHREVEALRHKLELVEEEKNEWSDKLSKAEVEVKDLRFTVEELQKRIQAVTNPPPAPPPAPAPPPPPPPPPPAPSTISNPLSSLLSLIRKKRDVRTDIALEVQDPAKTPDVDVRRQAVEEMMQRIQRGVQLRPVVQAGGRERMERLPSDSAVHHLHHILGKVNRTSPQQPRTASPSTGGDEELQKILLRRRDALETLPED